MSMNVIWRVWFDPILWEWEPWESVVMSIGDSLLNVVSTSLLIMGVKKQFTIHFSDIFLLTERLFNTFNFFPVFQNILVEWARCSPDFVWLCNRQIKSFCWANRGRGRRRKKLESTMECTRTKASSFFNGSCGRPTRPSWAWKTASMGPPCQTAWL